MSEREDDRGGDEMCVKIDGGSKKTNDWKSLKEMKEYLRSEFEKKTKTRERNEGQTYLHFAAYLGHVDIVKVLIRNGADVNAVDRYMETALHFASKYGHVDVAKVLIQNGANVNAVDKWKKPALHWAARTGHVEVAKMLIRNGANVNAVEEDNWTALHIAAYDGHVDVAKVLIENGADVNAVEKDNRTSLCLAAQYGKVICTLQFLCFGAEIDEQTMKDDKTELLQPISDRLKLLRSGNRIGTSLLSDEERHFMWNLAFSFTIKHRVAAFKAYYAIRSFITFHGIFMGPGYDLGKRSTWGRFWYDSEEDNSQESSSEDDWASLVANAQSG